MSQNHDCHHHCSPTNPHQWRLETVEFIERKPRVRWQWSQAAPMSAGALSVIDAMTTQAFIVNGHAIPPHPWGLPLAAIPWWPTAGAVLEIAALFLAVRKLRGFWLQSGLVLVCVLHLRSLFILWSRGAGLIPG